MTQSECDIRLSTVTDVERTADEPLRFVATHEPY